MNFISGELSGGVSAACELESLAVRTISSNLEIPGLVLKIVASETLFSVFYEPHVVISI